MEFKRILPNLMLQIETKYAWQVRRRKLFMISEYMGGNLASSAITIFGIIAEYAKLHKSVFISAFSRPRPTFFYPESSTDMGSDERKKSQPAVSSK